ncbi:MAG TPA: hypothetical protein VGA94_01480, partial [Thermodesulfobacteriota bacterium]
MKPYFTVIATSIFLTILIITIIGGCEEEVSMEEGIVGPDGGVVIGSGDVVLEIPPGALDEDTFITVRLIDESEVPMPPPEGSFLVVGVELKPDGLEFNIPITITVPIDSEFQAGTPFPLLIFNPIDNTYEFEGEVVVNEDGISITFQTSHFSKLTIFYPSIAGAEEQERLKND